MLFSNLKLNLNLILRVSMMYKYVLTHQPNLVSLYALGRLHAPRQPLPPGEAANFHLKAYPGGYRGPTDQDPTSQSPPHGASSSPPQIWPLTLLNKRHLALPQNRSLALPRSWALALSRCRHLSHPRSWHLPLPQMWQRKPIFLCLTIRSTWRRSSISLGKVRHISPMWADPIMTLSHPPSSHMTR
jgi:hypothetical protein